MAEAQPARAAPWSRLSSSVLTWGTELSAGPAGVQGLTLTAYCVSVLSSQILIDVVPTLPDIPLPPIQANYRPLPSIESITCSQTKRKGTVGGKWVWDGLQAGGGWQLGSARAGSGALSDARSLGWSSRTPQRGLQSSPCPTTSGRCLLTLPGDLASLSLNWWQGSWRTRSLFGPSLLLAGSGSSPEPFIRVGASFL